MKRITLRSTTEFVGILVLLASLIILAVEIKQSNKIAIASIQYSILSDFNQHHNQVLENPEVAEFVANLKTANGKPFSPADEMRVHAFVTRLINIWFVIQTAYDNGQLTENTFRAYVEDAQYTLRHYPRAVPYFKESVQQAPSLQHLEIYLPIFEADEIASQRVKDD